MLGDRPTQPRDYSTIEKVAEQVRSVGRISTLSNFNIIEFLTGAFKLRLKANLEVKIFAKGEYKIPAFVRVLENGRIVELYVERSIWTLAAAGYEFQKYIIAHEMGHIMLHKHDILSWSENIPSWVKDLPATERAEPQANLFADLLLVPAHLLGGFPDADAIAEYFGVPMECAQRRFDAVLCKKPLLSYRGKTGEACPRCANFSLMREGLLTECEICGLKSDFSSAA